MSQTKDGKKWDGNVPTNYKIKYSPDGTEYVEEKNLGRWINRQRSLFQANRLRKDRQLVSNVFGVNVFEECLLIICLMVGARSVRAQMVCSCNNFLGVNVCRFTNLR